MPEIKSFKNGWRLEQVSYREYSFTEWREVEFALQTHLSTDSDDK